MYVYVRHSNTHVEIENYPSIHVSARIKCMHKSGKKISWLQKPEESNCRMAFPQNVQHEEGCDRS